MLLAIACGAFGAVASIVGKLALSDNLLMTMVSTLCEVEYDMKTQQCQYLIVVLRVMLFGIMIALNAAMVANFLRAMEKHASVIVTVVSTATNYLITGGLGRIIFKEKLGSWWLLGSVLICGGLCLIGISQDGITKHIRGR